MGQVNDLESETVPRQRPHPFDNAMASNILSFYFQAVSENLKARFTIGGIRSKRNKKQ
jgi:hypothetical protein